MMGFLVLVLLLIIPFASAGTFSNLWNQITGRATTSPVTLNISVGAGNSPTIWNVTKITDVSGGLNEGPAPTYVIINFSVTDADGIGNINDSSARVNLSKSGETSRINSSCARWQASGNSANYTCNMTMYWWDGVGNWVVNVTIKDLNGNYAENSTITLTVGSTSGFVSGPSSLTWATISPGATNTLANNNLRLNNTGNVVKNVQINATDLVGESTSSKQLGANNFSIANTSSCTGAAMSNYVYTAVSTLPIGNYSLNDGSSGQKDLYFCLTSANSDLTMQAYSTLSKGTWTVKIA